MFSPITDARFIHENPIHTDESYKRCKQCDRSYSSFPHSIDENNSKNTCWACFTDRHILSWDYKPNRWQLALASNDSGGVPLFGIENEVSMVNKPAGFVRNSVLSDMAYMKKDGSITAGEGAEVVWHPMSYNFIRTNIDLMTVAYDKKYTNGRIRADRVASCGLHVHVSRNSFKSPGHVYRFAKLLANPLARFVSKRRSKYWQSRTVARRYCNEIIPSEKETFDWYRQQDMQYDHSSQRYRHVNVLNVHTVEARIFQGTVNPRRIMKAVEFTKLALECSRNTSNDMASEGYMMSYAKKWVNQYSHVIEDICKFEEKV